MEIAVGFTTSALGVEVAAGVGVVDGTALGVADGVLQRGTQARIP
jgi:hypothetical protein